MSGRPAPHPTALPSTQRQRGPTPARQRPGLHQAEQHPCERAEDGGEDRHLHERRIHGWPARSIRKQEERDEGPDAPARQPDQDGRDDPAAHGEGRPEPAQGEGLQPAQHQPLRHRGRRRHEPHADPRQDGARLAEEAHHRAVPGPPPRRCPGTRPRRRSGPKGRAARAPASRCDRRRRSCAASRRFHQSSPKDGVRMAKLIAPAGLRLRPEPLRASPNET